jgi:tetratricopeptide (TPR) repeat protein
MSYSVGDYQRCRELALAALAEAPNDVELVRLAARASLELDPDEAITHLRHLLTLIPDDAASWHALGLALIDSGDTAAAADALRQASGLQPDDVSVLVDLGHAVYGLHHVDEAAALLTRALELDPTNLPLLRSLVEIHRQTGALQTAEAVARRITLLEPDNVLANLDVAELNLALGRFDEALAGYRRVQTIDLLPGHEAMTYHGMIEVQIQCEDWRRALDLVIDATRVARDELTTQLLSFVVARLFGDGDRPAPTRAEVDAFLSIERAEHRRVHAEAATPR